MLLLSVSSLRAQAALDPSGHWERTVQLPNAELSIEVDLAMNSNGELAGTMGMPTQILKGFPLLKVAAEGKVVGFHARRDQTFAGVLSADGKSMSGDFATSGYFFPFSKEDSLTMHRREP